MLKAKLAGSDRWEAFPLRIHPSQGEGHPSQRGQLAKASFQRVRRPLCKTGGHFIMRMTDTSFGCFKTMHAWCLIIIPNAVQNAFTLSTSFDMLIKTFCWAVYINKWLVNSTGILHLWLTMTPITDKRQLRTHTHLFFFFYEDCGAMKVLIWFVYFSHVLWLLDLYRCSPLPLKKKNFVFVY